MKRNVINLSFGILSVFLFFSCLDDNEDTYVSYGVMQNVDSSNSYEILTDKGNTLVVTKSQSSQSIENDKRVLVNYAIISDKDKGNNVYEIGVNWFYNLLSKSLINESYILKDEEARRDSIGNDPFNGINARFGGDYININFELWHSQSTDKKHMINLVYDDLRADSDTIYLRLYHNAYGEVPKRDNPNSLYKGLGRCSFKISDLLPEGVTSKPIKLTWTEYNYNFEPKEYSDTGVFKLGTTDKEREMSGGYESYIEVR